MKNILYIILFSILLIGCRDESELPDGIIDTQITDESENIDGIYVAFGTRSPGWSIEDEYLQFADNVGPNEEKPYIIDHFKNGDILFISQMGTTSDPVLYNMKTDERPDVDAGRPNYNKDDVKPNLYVYRYQAPDETADWTQGSNFVPYINENNDSTPLNWTKIRNLGSVGNAFSFYALFQGNNETPNCRTVQWMNYSGNDADYKPHSAYELGTRYGLYGAYHATSSLYTRMRFRMYPLFNLIQVTLLVPVKKNNPDTFGSSPGYTGFDSNAFMNNWLAGNESIQRLPGLWFGLPVWYNSSNKGIKTAFKINWRASRSSDNDPPFTEADNNTSNNINTCFYLLKYDINNPDAEHPPFVLHDVSKFYPGYKNIYDPVYVSELGEDEDEVRRYEFICYYVPQNTFSSTSFNALLSMRLLTPGSSGKLYHMEGSRYQAPMSVEGTYVPFFFYGNSKGQTQLGDGATNNFGLNVTGTYTHLTLYIPREGNETILVSARVEPWKHTYTDMTIVERDDENN